MLSLHELQQQFVASLTDNTHPFHNLIETTENFSAHQHLFIYQDSMLASLQRVLKEIYYVCYQLVGEDFFIRMANEFIAITPSISPDLGEYGKTFPEFIFTFTAANSLPYLADVAKLEWAWHRIYHAATYNSLDFEKLSACYTEQAENIIFLLPPESFLLDSTYPVHDIWKMNQKDFIGNNTLILEDNKKYFYLIWRKQFEKRVDLLSYTEWFMLTLIKQKFTLGMIAEKIPAIDFTEALMNLINRGWVYDFIINIP